MSLQISKLANNLAFDMANDLSSPGAMEEDAYLTTIHLLSTNPNGQSYNVAVEVSPEDGVSGDHWAQVETIAVGPADQLLVITNISYKAYRVRLRQLAPAAGVMISAWMFN